MKPWIVLSVLALLAVAAIAVVRSQRGDADPGLLPRILTREELEALTPDLDGDLRLIEHLRAKAGYEVQDWRRLEGAGRALFATLYLEEAARLGQLPMLASQQADPLVPIAESVAAYRTLGTVQAAAAGEALEQRFAADRQAPSADGAGKQGAYAPLAALAGRLQERLPEIRPIRLAFVREHLDELGK